MKSIRTVFFALLALLAAAPLSAQVIGVRVLDRTTDQPIPEVMVEALRGNGRSVQRVRTDRDGYAVIELPEGGEWRVRASRVGYQAATSTPVTVEMRQTIETVLRISSGEVVLDPLTVTARTQPPRNTAMEREGFYERERRGLGKFMTEYEVQRLLSTESSGIFRNVPGLRVVRSGQRSIVTVSRGSQECIPKLIVDNMPATGADVDNLVKPEEIRGVEIYRGSNEIPARWIGQANSCGLIVVWTAASG
jgi:hypothetical protein